MEANGIEYLALLFDLAVTILATFFLSCLYVCGEQDFGDIVPDELNLIDRAGSEAGIVGLTIAEPLLGNAINLKSCLSVCLWLAVERKPKCLP